MQRENSKDEAIFDYSELRGRIKTICGTEADFSEKMGISQNTLTNKFKRDGFNQSQIDKACLILSLNPATDITRYFFTKKVGKNSTM